MFETSGFEYAFHGPVEGAALLFVSDDGFVSACAG